MSKTHPKENKVPTLSKPERRNPDSGTLMPEWWEVTVATAADSNFAYSDPPDSDDTPNATRPGGGFAYFNVSHNLNPLRVLTGILLLLGFLTTISSNPGGIGGWRLAIYIGLLVAVYGLHWVGTSNQALKSLPLAVSCLLGQIGLAVCIALMVNSSNNLLGTTVFYVLWVVPFYIIAGQAYFMLSGGYAIALTGLAWLGAVGSMPLLNDELSQQTLLPRLLTVTAPFLVITVLINFIKRQATQRKQVLEALEQLGMSEERYRQLTERALDAIFTTGTDWEFSFANLQMLRLTSYNLNELMELKFSDIVSVWSRAVLEQIQGTVKGHQAKHQNYFSLEIQRKDGQTVLTEINAAPTFTRQGTHTGWVCIARDVTEREKMRQEVERRNRDLSALNLIATSASQNLNLEKMLNDVIITLVNTLKADVAAITVVSDKNTTLRVGGYHGEKEMVVSTMYGAALEDTEGLTRELVETGAPMLINDLQSEKRHLNLNDSSIKEMGLRSFAAAPLKSREQLVGVVSLFSHQPNAFKPDDIELLVSLGYSLASAVENARLYGTSQLQVREMTCLAEIARAINLAETFGQTLTNIAESISLTLGYKASAVTLIDSERLHITSYGAYGMPAGMFDRVNLLAQDSTVPRSELQQLPMFKTLLADTPTISTVASTTGKLAAISEMAIKQGWKSSIAVPVRVGGKPVGVISCYSTQAGAPSDSELKLLVTIANQASLVVQNAELFRDQQRRSEQLKAVSEVGRQIGAILNLEELLPNITRLVQQTFDYYLVGIYLQDADNPDEMVMRGAHGWNSWVVDMDLRFNIHQPMGLIAQVARTGIPNLINDVTTEPLYLDYQDAGSVKSELIVPIKRGEQVIGIIDIASLIVGEFDEIDLATMQAVSEQVAIALENARLYTEVKRVVIQLSHANLELEDATRHKSEFLANMSHELRTPLNAVIGFSEVLLDQVFGTINEKQVRYVNNILSSGRHLLTLVNDVLDLAKVEAGRMELHPEGFSPDEAVADVQNIVSVSATKKNIELKQAFEAKLAVLQADKSKFKQIMYNLLSNAVKFTPEDGTVTTGNYRHHENGNDYLAIYVRDTGIGIELRDQERIFEEFRQVDTSYARQHQGTGLGLALCRRLCELHGGRIWVESMPGVGSIFTFIMPLRLENAQPLNITPAPTEAIDRLLETREAQRTATGTILLRFGTTGKLGKAGPAISDKDKPGVAIFSDSDNLNFVLKDYLQSGGYAAYPVADIRALADAMAGGNLSPRLVLIDELITSVDAWQLLEQLHQNPFTAELPALLLTFDNETTSPENKAVAMLPRPFTATSLLEAVSATATKSSI